MSSTPPRRAEACASDRRTAACMLPKAKRVSTESPSDQENYAHEPIRTAHFVHARIAAPRRSLRLRADAAELGRDGLRLLLRHLAARHLAVLRGQPAARRGSFPLRRADRH